MFTWLYMTLRRSAQPTAHVDWARVFQHLPLRTLDRAMGVEIPAWKDWIEHPGLDDYWKQGRLDEDFATLDIPALHLTGLYDGDQPGEMFFWDGMLRSPAAASQHLLMGPWTHGGVFKPTQTQRDVDYTPASVADMDLEHLRWFDYWLKGIDNGVMSEPPVRYFYAGINEWRTGTSWPPADRVTTPLWLSSGGAANTSLGDGRLLWSAPSVESADSYVYDPADVAQIADVDFFNGLGNFSTRPADARELELRDDVLVYTSAPLEEDLYVSGRPSVVLHVSSDCPDTDVVVGLADVEPSGRSVPISRDEDHQLAVTQGGRLRMRFREGLDREVFMTPGEVYEVRISLRDTAHVFKAGHRVRLTVLSWDYPAMARNLNTDESIADGTTIRVATNTVHASAARPSRVELPVEAAR
jgi:putative CocE/NonD family hydrolase